MASEKLVQCSASVLTCLKLGWSGHALPLDRNCKQVVQVTVVRHIPKTRSYECRQGSDAVVEVP
jgi:hypothetical protein